MSIIGGDQSHNKSIQTGGSLLKQFRERKDKACMTRDRPQAYFLACDEDVPSAPSPDKRLTDPYVEVKANGSSTIVRRRVTAHRPTVSGRMSLHKSPPKVTARNDSVNDYCHFRLEPFRR